MKMLEVRDLSVRLGSREIVKDISFSVEEGGWLMIVGPNGAGKSTVVSAISQVVPYAGDVFFRGQNVREFKPHILAQHIGVLTQNHSVGYAFSVEEVVRLGRYAYSPGVFSRHTDSDERAVEEALELTGLRGIAKQSVLTLSGGELQRAFLAQIFAQKPELLVLDEPTNHLDLVYQKQIFSLIRQWCAEPGRAVISVVHDLSLAKLYGSGAVLLDNGRLAASGTLSEVLAEPLLNEVYRMDVKEWMRSLLGQWE